MSTPPYPGAQGNGQYSSSSQAHTKPPTATPSSVAPAPPNAPLYVNTAPVYPNYHNPQQPAYPPNGYAPQMYPQAAPAPQPQGPPPAYATTTTHHGYSGPVYISHTTATTASPTGYPSQQPITQVNHMGQPVQVVIVKHRRRFAIAITLKLSNVSS
eukprot:Nk52_evm15s1737 gene=Nk52_evmTU15s1737